MLRYSINKITYDYMQITIVYSNEEFFEMVQNSMSSNDTILDEDAYKDLENNQALKVFVQIDAEGIVSLEYKDKYKLLKNEEPILNIIGLDNKDNEEIICIISIPYINTLEEIKLVKLEDVKYNEVSLNDDDIKSIIDYIMIINNKFEKEDTDTVSSYCDTYIKFLGDDVVISSYKPSSYYLDFKQEGILFGKKIGDVIQIENASSKLFSGEYNISKIVKYKPLELTDDIAKELNYKNTKTKEEFVNNVISTYKKIVNFNNLINEVFISLNRINNLSVSKYSFNYFLNVNKIITKNKTKEEIYDIIKNRYISNYLYGLYEKENIDPFKMDKYFHQEYELLSLLGSIKDMSYEDYFNARIEDAYLYLLIKDRK